MLKKIFTILLILSGIAVVNACEFPDNMFSVAYVYDTTITVNLSVLTDIGKEGVNYFKVEDSTTMKPYHFAYCSYISHYNKNVLIEINNDEIDFVVDDTVMSLDDIQGDSCIYKEFEWLNSAGIVQMSKSRTETISHAFKDKFQSMVYWTKWDTLLGSEIVPELTLNNSLIRFVMTDCYFPGTAIVFPPEMLSLAEVIQKQNRYQTGISRLNHKNTEGKIYLIDGRMIRGKLNNAAVSAHMAIEYSNKTKSLKPHVIIH